MREATRTRFRQLLAQHDKEMLKAAALAAGTVPTEQERDQQFLDHARTVIEPVMAEAAKLMHDHGLQSAIVRAERGTDAAGKITPPSIGFEFRVLTDPETHGFPVTIPTLTFMPGADANTVIVHENSILPFLGGHVGIIDHCALPQMTAERVETHLLAIAEKVLRETGVS